MNKWAQNAKIRYGSDSDYYQRIMEVINSKYNNYMTKNMQFFRILQLKAKILSNYVTIKNMKCKVLETVRKYNLANSIVPALQQHVLNTTKASNPDFDESQLCDVLTYANVFDVFIGSCSKIRNMTNQIDLIMTKQHALPDLKTQRIRMSENFHERTNEIDDKLYNPINYLHYVGFQDILFVTSQQQQSLKTRLYSMATTGFHTESQHQMQAFQEI